MRNARGLQVGLFRYPRPVTRAGQAEAPMETAVVAAIVGFGVGILVPISFAIVRSLKAIERQLREIVELLEADSEGEDAGSAGSGGAS